MPEGTLGLHIKNFLSSRDGQQGNRMPLEEHSLESCKQRVDTLTDPACSGENPTPGWSFTYVPFPDSAGLLPHLQGKGPRRHEQGVLTQRPATRKRPGYPACSSSQSPHLLRGGGGGTLADVPPDPTGGWPAALMPGLPLHLTCTWPLHTAVPQPRLHLAPGLSCVLRQEERRRVPSSTARSGKAQKCLELYHGPLVMWIR